MICRRLGDLNSLPRPTSHRIRVVLFLAIPGSIVIVDGS